MCSFLSPANSSVVNSPTSSKSRSKFKIPNQFFPQTSISFPEQIRRKACLTRQSQCEDPPSCHVLPRKTINSFLLVKSLWSCCCHHSRCGRWRRNGCSRLESALPFMNVVGISSVVTLRVKKNTLGVGVSTYFFNQMSAKSSSRMYPLISIWIVLVCVFFSRRGMDAVRWKGLATRWPHQKTFCGDPSSSTQPQQM